LCVLLHCKADLILSVFTLIIFHFTPVIYRCTNLMFEHTTHCYLVDDILIPDNCICLQHKTGMTGWRENIGCNLSGTFFPRLSEPANEVNLYCCMSRPTYSMRHVVVGCKTSLRRLISRPANVIQCFSYQISLSIMYTEWAVKTASSHYSLLFILHVYICLARPGLAIVPMAQVPLHAPTEK